MTWTIACFAVFVFIALFLGRFCGMLEERKKWNEIIKKGREEAAQMTAAPVAVVDTDEHGIFVDLLHGTDGIQVKPGDQLYLRPGISDADLEEAKKAIDGQPGRFPDWFDPSHPQAMFGFRLGHAAGRARGLAKAEEIAMRAVDSAWSQSKEKIEQLYASGLLAEQTTNYGAAWDRFIERLCQENGYEEVKALIGGAAAFRKVFIQAQEAA